jgi:hypothetical protein
LAVSAMIGVHKAMLGLGDAPGRDRGRAIGCDGRSMTKPRE